MFDHKLQKNCGSVQKLFGVVPNASGGVGVHPPQIIHAWQSGRETLNNFEQLTEWQTVLNSYFKQEMIKMRTTSRTRKDHIG
jgi:hypothetical protein